MVIMLFFIILIIFPIKLSAKSFLSIKNGYLTLKFFVYHLFVIDINLFTHNDNLYLKIGKNKPSEFVLDFSNKGKSVQIPFNPLRLLRANICLYIGGSPQNLAFYNAFINAGSSFVLSIIDDRRIKVKCIPAYYSEDIILKINLSVFTNLLALIIVGVLYLIKKIFTKKETKNAIQQSY